MLIRLTTDKTTLYVEENDIVSILDGGGDYYPDDKDNGSIVSIMKEGRESKFYVDQSADEVFNLVSDPLRTIKCDSILLIGKNYKPVSVFINKITHMKHSKYDSSWAKTDIYLIDDSFTEYVSVRETQEQIREMIDNTL